MKQTSKPEEREKFKATYIQKPEIKIPILSSFLRTLKLILIQIKNTANEELPLSTHYILST